MSQPTNHSVSQPHFHIPRVMLPSFLTSIASLGSADEREGKYRIKTKKHHKYYFSKVIVANVLYCVNPETFHNGSRRCCLPG